MRSNLTFDPSFKVKLGSSIFKGPKARLILVLEVSNVKATCRKSCPANLLMRSYLTFHPSFHWQNADSLFKWPKIHFYWLGMPKQLRTNHEIQTHSKLYCGAKRIILLADTLMFLLCSCFRYLEEWPISVCIFVSVYILTLVRGQNAGGQNAGQNCKGGQNAGRFWDREDKMPVFRNT